MSVTKILKNKSLFKTQAFVNGKFIGAKAQFAVHNPATGEEIAQVGSYGPETFEKAIKDANVAFKQYKKLTARQKSSLLYKYYDLMVANKDDLARLITIENGKPFNDSLGEVNYAASFLQWFAEEAPRVNGDVIPSANPNARMFTVKQPLGVCGILTPWNFPAAMITRKLGALLAAGNTAVIKPAAETPLTALALAQLSAEAGFPEGVVNIIPTSAQTTPVIGEFVCEHPTVKKISFTGSTQVGKLLMKQSASTLKKMSMELGGNAPFIVFEDADLELAAKSAVVAKFRQSGQTCICANRLFVHAKVHDKFLELLAREMQKFVVGDGFGSGVTHGPVIHGKAMSKIETLLADAQQHGAKVVVGGNALPEKGKFFYEPTLVSNVDPSMKIYHEEIFGPIAPVIKFGTTEEVISMANDTDVGLAGYFFSSDVKKIVKVAEELEIGMVGANTGALSEAALPFGGVKQSGIGREGSVYGINDWLNVKTVVLGL